MVVEVDKNKGMEGKRGVFKQPIPQRQEQEQIVTIKPYEQIINCKWR